MATYKRNKSGGSQSEGASNSASPASSVALSNPSSSQGINNNAPKYGTLVPNRIFVGGISTNTTEAELSQLFSKYGNVKATKIIADRAGVSKGYGFVTFESEEEVKYLLQDSSNIVLKERRLNIAPAVKKQPCSRPFDTSSPPPTTPNLYFHNGVPYTFHNGMAFFPSTAHQPTLTTLPPSADPSMYPPYGPTQNTAPAPYGTPVLLPAPPPVFMPQNYSYQPLPMTNGAHTQFIYAGSGSSNSSGSPLAGTPDNPHMPPPMPPQFYPQQFPPQDTFYHQPIYIYSYSSSDYDIHEQQTPNDESSSTVSTPRSDGSERSSNRSPMQPQYTIVNKNKVDHTRPSAETQGQNSKPQPTQTNNDQVPVVSWQNAEERQLHIRDGRRAFRPIPPPPPTPPQIMMYQTVYPPVNPMYPQAKPSKLDSSRIQGPQMRNRPRYNLPINNIPFIPKFPDSFNNNNPLTTNNNFHDKKAVDVSNGRSHRFFTSKMRGGIRGSRNPSPPPPSNPKPTNSFVSSPSPQMMQPTQLLDRSVVAVNSAPRWPSNSHQVKRLVYNKRQNGSTPNLGATNNSGNIRLTKKTQAAQDGVEGGDSGGGGDAQPMLQLALTPPTTPSGAGNTSEVSSKMQSLSLTTSS